MAVLEIKESDLDRNKNLTNVTKQQANVPGVSEITSDMLDTKPPGIYQDKFGLIEAGGLAKEGLLAIPGDFPRFIKGYASQFAELGNDDFSEIVGQAFSAQTPESAERFIKRVSEPEMIKRPIQDAGSFSDLAQGLVEKTFPGMVEDFEGKDVLIDAVADHIKKKRLSLRGALEDFSERPLDLLQDVSDVAAVMGYGVSKFPGVLGQKGEKLMRFGQKIDPISLLSRSSQRILRGVGKMGSRFLGDILSGVGQRTIEKQFGRTPAFVKALKGEKEYISSLDMEVDVTLKKIVNNTVTASKAVKKKFGNDYAARLKHIQDNYNYKPMDFRVLREKVLKKLEEFEVTLTGDPSNPIDYSGSKVGRSSQQDMTDIYKEVDRFFKIGDFRPLKADNLKQRLGDFFTDGDKSSVLLTEVTDEIKDILNKNVDGYAELTGNYEQAMEIYKEIKDTFSIKGSKTRADTVLRKLITAMKNDKGFESAVLTNLEQLSGIDLRDQVAGVLSRQVTPQGLIGKVADMHLIYAGIMNADPLLGSVVLSSSPNVLAKFMNVLGKFYRGGTTIAKGAEWTAPIAIRTGQLKGFRMEERPRLSEPE